MPAFFVLLFVLFYLCFAQCSNFGNEIVDRVIMQSIVGNLDVGFILPDWKAIEANPNSPQRSPVKLYFLIVIIVFY